MVLCVGYLYCDEQKIVLKNGQSIEIENKLPNSIKQFYDIESLENQLNNPIGGSFKEYPFNCRIIIDWDDSGKKIEITLYIGKSNIINNITIHKYYNGLYLDMYKSFKYLQNVMWWAKDIPITKASKMSDSILHELYAKDMQGLLVFFDDNVKIQFPFYLIHQKNGIFLDPKFYMQYPIMVNEYEVYPNKMSQGEFYSNWSTIMRYPVSPLIDPITLKENELVHKLLIAMEIDEILE